MAGISNCKSGLLHLAKQCPKLLTIEKFDSIVNPFIVLSKKSSHDEKYQYDYEKKKLK
jgi:hypothetical protein